MTAADVSTPQRQLAGLLQARRRHDPRRRATCRRSPPPAAPQHADRMLAHMNAADRDGVTLLLGVFRFLPRFVVRGILRLTERHAAFPEPIAGGAAHGQHRRQGRRDDALLLRPRRAGVDLRGDQLGCARSSSAPVDDAAAHRGRRSASTAITPRGAEPPTHADAPPQAMAARPRRARIAAPPRASPERLRHLDAAARRHPAPARGDRRPHPARHRQEPLRRADLGDLRRARQPRLAGEARRRRRSPIASSTRRSR